MALDPEAVHLNRALVEDLKRRGCIRTPRVEAAFRAVRRHLFLPGVPLDAVYRDQVIVTKRQDGLAISSSSQPAIMAIMLEQLALEPGHRVLEIGAGTGYNAALMAHIVGDTGGVVTVDIDGDLVAGAREHLAAAGFPRVHVVRGDGALGYPDGVSCDRIILTVGSADVAPAWREQLDPGGRLLLPLSIRRGVQRSVAFEGAGDHLVSVSVEDCAFIGLRGACAEPRRPVALGPYPGLFIGYDGAIDPDATSALLTGPSQDRPTGVRVGAREVFGGLVLWLALRESAFCGLSAEGEAAERRILPCLLRFSGGASVTAGLFDGASLCLLTLAADDPARSCSEWGGDPTFELVVRSFGPGVELANRLLGQVAAWEVAGRPSTEGLRVRAYPVDVEYLPSRDEFVVTKRWTRLVVDWPATHPGASRNFGGPA